MTYSLTADTARADVLIYAEFFTEAGTQTHVTITRLNPDGTETVLITDHLLLCDEVYFYDTTVPIGVAANYRFNTTPDDVDHVEGPVTVTADDTIRLGDPSRPWANLVLDLCGDKPGPCGPAPSPCLSFASWGTETYAADANLIPIHGATRPADVYARRKDAAVSSLRFLSRHATDDCSCIEGVRTLFTAGGPVYMRFPPEYCIPDRTYQPGDVTMSYLSGQSDLRKPYRLWEVPLIAVEDVPGPAQGPAGITWCDVNDTFATYADLTASGLFWGNVVAGGF